MSPNLYQQYGAYRHIRLNTFAPATHFHGLASFGDPTVLTSFVMPPNIWPSTSASYLATQYPGLPSISTFQALTGNVLCVCLCRCTNMYIIHQIVIIINSHQAYIIRPTQYLDIYITHHNITKQWPIIAERKSLAAAEQQARCSDNQARCSDKLQHLGFPNLSQPVAVRTILTVASAPCLDQPNHKFQGKFYYSQTEPTHCNETHTRCSKCPQHHGSTKPSLLIAASAHVFHQLSIKSQLSFSTKSTYHKFYFAVNIQLHLPHSQNLLLWSMKRSTPWAQLTGFLTTFYNQVRLINIHANIILNS